MELTKDKYTMSEVSELLQVNTHQIRHWEKEIQLTFPRDERNRRFFTKKDVEILTVVKDAIDKSLSLSEIRKQLIKNGMIAEQNENAIQKMNISDLTPEELKDAMSDMFEVIMNKREENLKKEFEITLSQQLEEQKNELKKEFKKDLEEQSEVNNMKLEAKIREQISSENQKLIDYIAATREEDKKKGFFSRLFGK